MKNLLQKYKKNPAPAHVFYKDWFNLVDLVDRRWYSVEEHHQHQSWKTKMIIAMMRFAVINAWVYNQPIEYQKWEQWREEIAKELMKL